MAVDLLIPAKATRTEEIALNALLAKRGGFASAGIPWFKLTWAATDFIRDRDADSCLVKEYPRCLHEKRHSYHILKYHPHASVFGGEYICTGIHLLDVTSCPQHRNNPQAIINKENPCLCEPVQPNQTICEVIVPIIERNRVRSAQAYALAMETTRLRHNMEWEQFVQGLTEPFRPSYSGRMPEPDHPAVTRLLEANHV